MSDTGCIDASMEAAINNISIRRTSTDMSQVTQGKSLNAHCATTAVIKKGF